MPILHPSGLMMPGQLGPTRRDFDWLLSAFMTCSGTGAGERNLNGCEAEGTFGHGTHPDFV